ncbi:YdcF family protein [Roseomonas frigidaquae]|uniref:YdcF family protein n=1 Tax=Falsiroseomonas frigidaquae TaxID=487318 RepID=A0ABX1EZE6_9PROT|nr:YdcF family protein [Falsiroseomonas frigidaquae]NKE45442.1 YdcF family protein [Falsiroseomonas frigidaquae]
MNQLQNALAPLLLPPLALVLLALLAGLLAANRARRQAGPHSGWAASRSGWAGLLAAACSFGVLLLATPLVAGLLIHSLDAAPGEASGEEPGAIIILGGDMAQGLQGAEVGLLTLERLRAGAALHRESGLPILVTGGTLSAGQPPLARLMARSLEADFGVPARWVEARAADTRENAAFATALLRADGVAAAWLVTQGWHMPRAQGAFARQHFPVRPAPVRRSHAPVLEPAALLPRADHLTESWFALHEWAGRAFYALRDGWAP